MAQSYRDLLVWQRGMQFVTEIYGETAKFPRHELYGLVSQLRRAAVSVVSNIAEGKGRSDKDFSRFLLQARGSLLEIETQLLVSRNLGYITEGAAETLCGKGSEVAKMLNGMLRALRPSPAELTTAD